MKKFQHHLSFSIFLQVLGILVNGVLGMGLEMIGLSILNLKNKKTLISLLKKFVFVIVSQILIDLVFGNDATMLEVIFFYLEKMSVVIIAMIQIFIGLLILNFFQKYFIWYCPGIKFPTLHFQIENSGFNPRQYLKKRQNELQPKNPSNQY